MKKSSRIYLSPPHMCGSEARFVRAAFKSNYIAPAGPQVREFEGKFAGVSGFKHCAALASGTAALHLALRYYGVGKGDTVLCQSLTFIGGVSPVTFLGAQPVFVDSDLLSWNMDMNLLETELKRRAPAGKKVKAGITADIYGQPADLDVSARLCEKYGAILISDSCEAVGARYKGRFAGKGAKAAIYSFNGNKIITTSGGGMLASNDEALIKKAKFWAEQAREPFPYYQHETIGYNYRLSNISAAIGLGQLTVLKKRVKQCRDIFQHYYTSLKSIDGVGFMPEPDWSKSNRWLTVITLDPNKTGVTPEAVRLALEKENIESRPLWKPMHLQPVFAKCAKVGGAVSEKLFKTGLCLPSGTAMTKTDLNRVCAVIKRTIANAK
jgi:dTDP-4-amino-4,6-dideoxygalactose transaminase